MAGFESYEEQRRILEALKQIDTTIRGVDKTIKSVVDGAKKGVSGIGDSMKRTTTEAERGLKSLQAEQNKYVQLQVSNLDALSAKIDDAMNRAREAASKAFTSVDQSAVGNMLWGREGFNAISGKMGGLRQLVRSGQQDLFAGMPAAGLIGLMLYGRKTEEEWRTAGEKSIQIFDRVKAASRDQAGALGEMMRQSKIGGIDPADFAASVEALTSAGLSADDALAPLRSSITGISESVLEWTVRMDKAFELGSGASAKAVGEIMASTGAGVKEAAAQFEQLGLAARSSGLDMTAFVGTMTQAASSMRMQKQDVDALAKTFSFLRSAMPSGSAQFTGGLAASALGDVSGAVSSMQIGMKEMIGQRILKQRFGVSADALGGIRAMDLGFQEQTGGAQFDTIGESLKQLLAIKEERTQGLSAGQKARYLEGISGGKISGGLAQRLATMTGQETGVGGVGDTADQFREELVNAIQGEKNKKSPEEVLLEQLQDVIARIGAAVLTTITNGFMLTVAGLQALLQVIAHPSQAGDVALQFASTAQKGMKRVGASFERAYGSASNLPAEAKDLVEGLIGGKFGLDSVEDAKKELGTDPNKISTAKFSAASLASTLIPGAGLVSLALGAKAASSAFGDSDALSTPVTPQTVYANGTAPDGSPVPFVITVAPNPAVHEPVGAGGG